MFGTYEVNIKVATHASTAPDLRIRIISLTKYNIYRGPSTRVWRYIFPSADTSSRRFQPAFGHHQRNVLRHYWSRPFNWRRLRVPTFRTPLYSLWHAPLIPTVLFDHVSQFYYELALFVFLTRLERVLLENRFALQYGPNTYAYWALTSLGIQNFLTLCQRYCCLFEKFKSIYVKEHLIYPLFNRKWTFIIKILRDYTKQHVHDPMFLEWARHSSVLDGKRCTLPVKSFRPL